MGWPIAMTYARYERRYAADECQCEATEGILNDKKESQDRMRILKTQKSEKRTDCVDNCDTQVNGNNCA